MNRSTPRHGNTRLALSWVRPRHARWAAIVACFAWLLGVTSAVRAQLDDDGAPNVKIWTARDGLPQNSVTDVLHGRDGYLWIATFGGLARFDGLAFKTYDVHRNPGLPSNRIVRLLEDQDGILWLAHEDHGVSRLVNGRFEVVASIPSTGMSAMVAGADGAIICGGEGGVLRVDSRSLRRLATRDGDLQHAVQILHRGTNGVTWAATPSTLHRLDSGERSPAIAPLPATAGDISAIQQDSYGVLWIGTSNGLLVYDGKGWTVASRGEDSDVAVTALALFEGELHVGTRTGGYVIPRLDPLRTWSFFAPQVHRAAALRNLGSVRVFSADRAGNLWVGTDGRGLVRVRKQRVARLTTAGSAPLGTVTAVTGDGANGLWFAQQCGRLWHLSGTTLTTLDAADQATIGCVNALYADASSRLWIGHKQQLSQWIDGRITTTEEPGGPDGGNIAALMQDRRGAMWVGTDHGVLRMHGTSRRWFRIQDGLADDSVHAIAVATNGDVWIGSKGGLSRIRGDSVHTLTHADGLPHGRVRAIHEAPDGVMWVGTYGGGLARVGSRRLTQVNTRHGLAENFVSRILDDGTGRWWMLGNRGLQAVAWRDLQAVADGRAQSVPCVTLQDSDGMTEGNGGSSPAGWRLPSGTLYFPTIDGLARLVPSSDAERSAPPTTHLRRVTLTTGEARTLASGKVTLSPEDRRVEVEFVGINLASPLQVRYRHRLAGYDATWVEGRARRRVSYTNLAPGEYQFVAQARNQTGAWETPGAKLTLIVQPAWWQTWLFRGGAAAGVLLLPLLVTGLWVQQQRRTRAILESTVAERTSALAEAMTEAKTLAAEAARANRAKSEFLAWMSHELRTPLVSVVGFADLLRPAVAADPVQLRQVDAIASSGAHLLELINDLLDLSMIESRVMTVESRDTDLHALVRRVTEMLQQPADAKGVRLELTIDPDVPRWVDTDPRRLRQVLLNVVGNAVKFTREGQVSVRVTAMTQPERVRFEVHDTGPGIASDALESVFELFRRASSDVPGTGLGLPISRQLVTLLGGTMQLTSVVGQGTSVTFEVRAPLSRAALRTTTPEQNVAARGQHGGTRVLVVDDVAVNRLLITTILTIHGFDVREAASGEASLTIAAAWRPALVCMDLRMPGMGGMAAAEQLRRDASEVKLIALTASLIALDDVTGPDSPFDGALAKPFLIEPFLEIVARILGATGEPPVVVDAASDVTPMSADVIASGNGSLHG